MDRLPRDGVGGSRVVLKQVECERERERERERRRGTGSIPSWPCIAGAAEGPAIISSGGDA
jgi:hypothetical protein